MCSRTSSCMKNVVGCYLSKGSPGKSHPSSFSRAWSSFSFQAPLFYLIKNDLISCVQSQREVREHWRNATMRTWSRKEEEELCSYCKTHFGQQWACQSGMKRQRRLGPARPFITKYLHFYKNLYTDRGQNGMFAPFPQQTCLCGR